MSGTIEFSSVSKFYGEVLGVDRVTVSIPPGITSLVGPNGSGKTTLLNLATGLLRPTRGEISVLGASPSDPETIFRLLGYCAQWDSFPSGVTGRSFVVEALRLHGLSDAAATRDADEILDRVGLLDAAARPVAGYSKGMRQKARLARALAHKPRVLLLDEPLNGLDPMARAEVITLFRALADEGLHVVVSSHILHEVDLISDRVLLVKGGYIVAEGDIHGVRSDLDHHPMQLFVRTDRPARLAARLLEEDHVVEVQMHEDGAGLSARTRDADRFFLAMNRIVREEGFRIETMRRADDDVQAVYRYLIESDGEAR